ncbi:MAG: PA14 domain-containing protein [Chloroflexi bacterium]|nr:PA14 domain-containing protein [Chloroflexota bacterium]
MNWGRALFRIFLCVVATAVTTLTDPSAYAARPLPHQLKPYGPRAPLRKPNRVENARVVLNGLPDDIIPQNSNTWQCPCDSDGCWPGCFTVASATILKYWAQQGFPNLWDGDENGTLVHLRELFPNLLCYGNGDDNGKPGDSGYDAFDVASGLNQFITEKGYVFNLTPIPEPSFDQIVTEIDAGRPIIGAFGESPWGSHAGTIIGYDTTGGRKIMVVRPNLWQKLDTDLEWGAGYQGFGIVTIAPGDEQANQPVAPQVTFEVLVNDKDTGFAAQGNWAESLGLGYGGEARSVRSTDPSNLGPTDDTGWARWNPQLPFDGMWEVMAWMPLADVDDAVSHVATYRVTHAEGMSLARRSQHDAVQGWMSLGAFPFVKGDKGNVYLGNLTGDNPPRQVWADAVRFVWRAPLIVRQEGDDDTLYLVANGKRARIPDSDTFDALRLSKSNIRKLSTMTMDQYPPGEALPSIYGGWIGQYFNNTVLAQPASVVRADPSVNFHWNGAAPAANMSALGFSARWSRIMALSEGDYPFNVEAVGGVRLWIDGRLEINAWDSPNIYLQHQREISVTSGLHRVEIEYANREGYARITLGNLPPNVPIVVNAGAAADKPVAQWTSAPTMTVNWLDGGDADSAGKPRKFYVSVWREGDLWNASSEWITPTEWTIPLADDGHYYWRVSASDGTAVSGWSQVQEIWVDRTPPWAQMELAETQDSTSQFVVPVPPLEEEAAAPETQTTETPATETPAAQTPATQTPESSIGVPADAPAGTSATATVDEATGAPALPVIDPATGTIITQATMLAPGESASTSDEIAATPAQPVPLPQFGIRLTWYATDTLSGPDSFDLQARELIHASTIYTPAVEMREVTRISYELVISGAQQITNALVLTELVPYTTVVPLRIFTPLTNSEWITFVTGVANTTTVFLGNPGSTYEFRVRGRDKLGNWQQWYEGYSVQAQVNSDARLLHVYVPALLR